MGGAIPTGTVTFLFTDVERSTRLWEDYPSEMQAALGRHDQLVRAGIEDNGGYVFSLAGDQFVAAFQRVVDALRSAADIQRSIGAEDWPEPTPIRVRIGVHVGEAEERDGDYFGQVLNRTARIVAVASGGQTVLSGAAAGLVDREELIDLGEHRLKDLVEAEHLWQFGGGSFPELRSQRVAKHNLVVERTALVGRDKDIASLAPTVMKHRLVTLLGIGGTGKTRLANALAAEVLDEFVDGAWFVDLVPAADLESIAEAIASAAGLRIAGVDLLDALATQAADSQMLLVIDNCEHVTEQAADVIDRLLARCEHLRIVATSREPLDLADEHQVHVAPLLVAESPTSPAVQLFISAASRVGVEISPTDDIAIVAQICEQLDGLPLSVELAAAQLRQLELADLAERLDSRFELLTRGRSSGRRRRHSSLLDVLEDSWEMLENEEQRLLMLLAAFPASFALVDVETMAEAHGLRMVGRTLGGLIDRGMIARDGSGVNRLLETVKLFVRQRWPGEDDPDFFSRAHSDWLLGYLRAQDDTARYQSVALVGWAMSHYDDHRTVENRLAAANQTEQLAELLGALLFTYSRETGQRASGLISRVEHYLEDLPLTTAEEAALRLTAAAAGRPARRAEWLAKGSAEAVRLYRLVDDPVSLSVALLVATFSKVLRDPAAAFADLAEAQEIAQSCGAGSLVDVTLAYRAHYAAMAGDTDQVRRIVAELEAKAQDDTLDNVRIMTLQAKMVANLVSDPGVARAAISECLAQATLYGLENDWWIHLYLASAAGADGDASEMGRHLADAKELLAGSGTDGLPDLLIPYIALARVTGYPELSQRWASAIRHAGTRLGTGVVIGLYRNLRIASGLASNNPLDESTLIEIYDEAQLWSTDRMGEG